MAFTAFNPQSAAEKAISIIGFGYDLCKDIRLPFCKSGPCGSRLIEVDQSNTRDLVVPGGVVVPDVSTSIKCDKGERTRFRSDVLSFNQVILFLFLFFLLGGKIWWVFPSFLWAEISWFPVLY